MQAMTHLASLADGLLKARVEVRTRAAAEDQGQGVLAARARADPRLGGQPREHAGPPGEATTMDLSARTRALPAVTVPPRTLKRELGL